MRSHAHKPAHTVTLLLHPLDATNHELDPIYKHHQERDKETTHHRLFKKSFSHNSESGL